MDDSFNSAQRNINQQSAEMLKAVAEAGTQGKIAFQQAQQGIDSGRAAATKEALARAAQIAAPAGAGQALAAQIAVPFDRQTANIAGAADSFNRYGAARAASHKNYLSEVNAALPFVRAAAERSLQERIGKQSELDEKDLRDELVAQSEIDAENARTGADAAQQNAVKASGAYNSKQAAAIAATNAYNAAKARLSKAGLLGGQDAAFTAAKKPSFAGKLRNGLPGTLISSVAPLQSLAFDTVRGPGESDAQGFNRLAEEKILRSEVDKLRSKSLAAGRERDAAKTSSLSVGAQHNKAVEDYKAVSDPVLAARRALEAQGLSPARARMLTNDKFAKSYESSTVPDAVRSISTRTNVAPEKIEEAIQSPGFSTALDSVSAWVEEGQSQEQIIANLKANGLSTDDVKIALDASRALGIRKETAAERKERQKKNKSKTAKS